MAFLEKGEGLVLVYVFLFPAIDTSSLLHCSPLGQLRESRRIHKKVCTKRAKWHCMSLQPVIQYLSQRGLSDLILIMVTVCGYQKNLSKKVITDSKTQKLLSLAKLRASCANPRKSLPFPRISGSCTPFKINYETNSQGIAPHDSQGLTFCTISTGKDTCAFFCFGT